MITVDFLAAHPCVIPTLAKWFRTQWPAYFADQSQVQMEQGFLSEAARDRLPIRLIAFASGEVAGTIVLRQDGTMLSPEFQPELGGLYVIEVHRHQGIGAELVRAGMQLARDQGYSAVYATTVAAKGILEGLGWEFVKTVIHGDEELALYQCKL